jgi:hypothetical protein
MNPVPQFKKARQETGEPSYSDDIATGGQAEAADIEARLLALEALMTADLRIEWRRLYRATPPTRLSRDLLIRGVAYKIQEQASGGLSLGIRRMLRVLATGSDRPGGAAATPRHHVEAWHQAGSRMASARAYGQRSRRRVRVSG